MSRAQGGQCRGKEATVSLWAAQWIHWQEPRSISHQLHQMHSLLLSQPLLLGSESRGAWHRGHLKGRALSEVGRQGSWSKQMLKWP